jgi:hypothetical protein
MRLFYTIIGWILALLAFICVVAFFGDMVSFATHPTHTGLVKTLATFASMFFALFFLVRGIKNRRNLWSDWALVIFTIGAVAGTVGYFLSVQWLHNMFLIGCGISFVLALISLKRWEASSTHQKQVKA